jgi:hypothetical protein
MSLTHDHVGSDSTSSGYERLLKLNPFMPKRKCLAKWPNNDQHSLSWFFNGQNQLWRLTWDTASILRPYYRIVDFMTVYLTHAPSDSE